MDPYLRQPPRFVPTLTEVVPQDVGAPAVHGVPAPAEALPLDSVETEVLAAAQAAVVDSDAPMPVPVPQAAVQPPDELPNARAETVVDQVSAQVMGRVDALLEERLRYGLVDLVQLHTQQLVQQLRQEIATMVQQSVHDAVAEAVVQAEQAARTKV